jgi:hypothetical protein
MPRAADIIRRRSALVVRSQLGERSALDQLTQDFLELVVISGGVLNEDLLVIGWTQEQINRLSAKARIKALEQQVRECAA